MANFIIGVDERSKPRREVRVVVYDKVRWLRHDSTCYENRTKSINRKRRGDFHNTLGICHCFEWCSRDGEVNSECALVRLAKPNIGVGIISHEMAHAAVWIHELNHPGHLITNGSDESFAWVLGELVRQCVNEMNDRGVFDDEGEELLRAP